MLSVLGLTLRITVLDAISCRFYLQEDIRVRPMPHSQAESGSFNSFLKLWLGDVPSPCLILLEHNRGEVGKQPVQQQRVCILIALYTFIKEVVCFFFFFLRLFHQPPIHMVTAGLLGALLVTQDIIPIDVVESSRGEYLAETKVIILV